MNALVTGAAGSVGAALVERLLALGHEVAATDVDTLDVTDAEQVASGVTAYAPDVVFHLAAAKHAPEGELDPEAITRVNVTGTAYVVRAAQSVGARVVFASTCKACDPETAYGASKLIAERIVLNAAGTVVRYFNIPEASGNVFRLWEAIEPSAPIPWTDCLRFFVPMRDAVALTLRAAVRPSGRYVPVPGDREHMRAVAARLYPDRDLVQVPRRRGDRREEPRHAAAERVVATGHGFWRVAGPHDPPERRR